MSKKSNNFFEEHIEKIVLAVVGLVCLWLFITRVLFSPISVEYNNKEVDPDAIDTYISKQAAVLESKLNRGPESKQPYEPQADDFIALLDSSISDIDTSLALPKPSISSKDISDNRVYHIPKIGKVEDVVVEHIRTVAYVPTMQINENNPYSSENSEPNDIDFVTVEAKFDVSELYERFNESFAGEHIRQDWRDPCLARPVFASVQLQRQELLSDGSWSDWQTVPRSRLNRHKSQFEVIENVNKLPAGGIKVRLLQFDNPEVTMDLLQPEAYQIASAEEEWFPPSLHKKYVEYQREIDVRERRAAAIERRGEREGERPERSDRTRSTGTTNLIDMGPSSAPPRKTPTRRSRVDRRDERERPQRSTEVSRTIDDIHQEFDEILIDEQTNLSRLDEPLLFWAYDDTVEPYKSYRYRIRLGVFNPIAGTNKFREQDKSMKNKVILWSQFSDTTKVVDIPGILYFFPREIQEAAKAVTVQVSRYVLGYWYSRDFTVKPGELIGKVSDYKITEDEEQMGVAVPQRVDYATNAVMVDIVPVNDWSGGDNLRARHFFDMLYSFEGKNIKHLPIKTRYWSDALQTKFNEIKRAERESKKPLRDWGGRTGERRRTPTPGIDTPPGYDSFDAPPPGRGQRFY